MLIEVIETMSLIICFIFSFIILLGYYSLPPEHNNVLNDKIIYIAYIGIIFPLYIFIYYLIL